MYCGRCCVTEPRLRAALQLDIFIEILLRTPMNKAGVLSSPGPTRTRQTYQGPPLVAPEPRFSEWSLSRVAHPSLA